jgi:DNA-binding transcriptional MerR regulator
MPRRKKWPKTDPVARGYGVKLVSKLTGIHPVRLHRWDQTRFIRPSIDTGGRGRGNRRRYSFQDILALRVAKRFRDEGVSLQALRRVVTYIRKLEDVETPLAERRVILREGDLLLVEEDKLLSVLEAPGQYRLLPPMDLGNESRKLLEDIERLAV